MRNKTITMTYKQLFGVICGTILTTEILDRVAYPWICKKLTKKVNNDEFDADDVESEEEEA